MKSKENSFYKEAYVSVVMSIYNTENYLKDAIESVLGQTLSNIELILINDGSTDGSEIICREYLLKDKRIKYFKQKNSGVSVGRNHGLKMAEGEYIFFMDSDDTIDAKFLETSYTIAKKNDSDIVVLGEYFNRCTPNVMALPTCAQLIKHNFLKKYSDIRFPKGIQPCEDGLFSNMILALTDKVSVNIEAQYFYRHHENQNHLLINKRSSIVLNQIPLWLNILDDFYTKYNLLESKSYHLALFIEHEPFEFRYLSMPFDNKQKKYLHKIIKDFMKKNVLPYIKQEDYNKLSLPFRIFLRVNNPVFFDLYNFVFIKKLKG